jgi:hypothetical protein
MTITDEEESQEATWETWIRQDDGTIDHQEEWNLPSEFSWAKNYHCMGSEPDRETASFLPYDNDIAWLPFT